MILKHLFTVFRGRLREGLLSVSLHFGPKLRVRVTVGRISKLMAICSNAKLLGEADPLKFAQLFRLRNRERFLTVLSSRSDCQRVGMCYDFFAKRAARLATRRARLKSDHKSHSFAQIFYFNRL